MRRIIRRALPALLLAAFAAASPAQAQAPLRVAILGDVLNFDPHQFQTINMPLIKNLHDSLIEYAPDGKPVPSLATAWTIAPDSRSVTLTLREGVKFHGGGVFDAQAVAATLAKAADPKRGKNVYPTMFFVKDWTVVNPRTIRIDFTAPAPERQVTDLLQFMAVIDPAVVDEVETKSGGTGAYRLAERVAGQRIRLVANPDYWRPDEPVAKEVVLTIFSEDAAATAALESGAVDLIYGGSARSAVRLKAAGYQLVQGPGPLVQVFRINSTRGPFRNETFRRAFNHLLDRAGILRVGYANLGEAVALPWAPASPAFDASYAANYAYDLDKAKALIASSGVPAAEASGWRLLVNGGDQPSVAISQVAQAAFAKAGIRIELDLKQGAEYVDALLNGKFDATFGAVGNVQKFPGRLTSNSIYRTVNNPILGTPHPHPAYVAAIDRVNAALGSGPEVKAAYDALNRVLVETAFGVPTNTYDQALIVAAKGVSGFTLDIDNMLVARTLRVAR